MTESNGNDPAPDGEPDDWTPTVDQPWRPVDPDQIIFRFDHGQPWCQERHAHPQYQPDGYPSLSHHPTDCQSYGGGWDGWYEDARAGLNGPPGFLSAYLVHPFRYGQRGWHTDDQERLAIEFAPQHEGAAEPFRCSIPAASIRNLARHLNLTADVGELWRSPRHVRQSLTD